MNLDDETDALKAYGIAKMFLGKLSDDVIGRQLDKAEAATNARNALIDALDEASRDLPDDVVSEPFVRETLNVMAARQMLREIAGERQQTDPPQ